MGKGLGEMNLVGGAPTASGSRRGRRPEEVRVSALDVRAALQDLAPLTRALRHLSATTTSDADARVISKALSQLQQAEQLAAGGAPAQWEQAELLVDQAFRSLGPAMSARGPQDPLARRFVAACNRDARRRGRHQIAYLHHRGLLNKTQADITARNVDKMFRAAALQSDRTATALAVLERAERACERLGSKEDITGSPAREQATRFIHGIARISAGYLQARMSKDSPLSDEQRARSETWLGAKAERQVQIAQAVASGLAHRSAEKATTDLHRSGALAAHQKMLTKIFGPDIARANSDGQWYALTEDAYRQARAANSRNDSVPLTGVPGLGMLTTEHVAREAVSAHADQHLSPLLMRALVDRCLPHTKPTADTHPAVARFHEGFRDGLAEALTVMAVRASGSREPTGASEQQMRWAQIVHGAARVVAPHAPGRALSQLARCPQTARLRTLAKLVTGRDDTSAQKLVVQVASKLASAADMPQRQFNDLCVRGWKYARQKAAQRRQLAAA